MPHCLWRPRSNRSPGADPEATPEATPEPELPAGRAERVLPSTSLVLTASQVGGHMLQHLDLPDGLPPGEMHHEHPVARREVLQPEKIGQELLGPKRGRPRKLQSVGPPAFASVVSSRLKATEPQRDARAQLAVPFHLPLIRRDGLLG